MTPEITSDSAGVADAIRFVLDELAGGSEVHPPDFDGLDTVESFEDAGLMTRDDGLVVTLADGAEFQVTVVRSR